MKKNMFLFLLILPMIIFGTLAVDTHASSEVPFGALSVLDGKLTGENGESVQLKGFSSHGIHWFPDFLNEESISFMKNNWNVTLVRAAMYTAQGGYLEDPSIEKTLDRIVEDAIDAGVYVIIDWHILFDADPLINVDEAVKFFERQAKKYGNTPNVIFEIANEPNGGSTWEGNILPYAKKVIPAIRKHSKNIIIVGTPTWSQELDKPLNNPIDEKNIMYAFHFYAGSHDHLMSKFEEAANENLPIFVTEWGTSYADGNGTVNEEKTMEWLSILDRHQISWANWNLADKAEASSALNPGASTKGGWTDDDLSPSGKIIVKALKNDENRTLAASESALYQNTKTPEAEVIKESELGNLTDQGVKNVHSKSPFLSGDNQKIARQSRLEEESTITNQKTQEGTPSTTNPLLHNIKDIEMDHEMMWIVLSSILSSVLVGRRKKTT